MIKKISNVKIDKINLDFNINQNSSIQSNITNHMISQANIDNSIEGIDMSSEISTGHSPSNYTDQEDILINGICSKLTNDIHNSFGDNDIKGIKSTELYPVFATIIEGKKISDIVDDEGRLKKFHDIISNSDRTTLQSKLNMTSSELNVALSKMDFLLTGSDDQQIKIVDYPDKMQSDIMNCKINKAIHEKSGFDAIVLEESNGNLMPIISGTNTGQSVDILADLYPIINNDPELKKAISDLDKLLQFNLYEDKLQSFINMKEEHNDIYWAIVNIFAKYLTEHPDIGINGFSIESLNWINDLGGDRNGVVFGVAKALAHLPEALNIPVVGDNIAEELLSAIGITAENPTLLPYICNMLGIGGRDRILVRKQGLLAYMEKCYETQKSEAHDLIKNTIETAKEKGTKVDINGYSLGGGLALTSYANICLEDKNMEEYVNSVTAYVPALIHTEREENGNNLINYISNSDKTKLFIVPGDLTSTYNNSLDILNDKIFYVKPQEKTNMINKVDVKSSFDNPKFKQELVNLGHKFNFEFTESEIDYAIKRLDPLREKYLYKEGDKTSNNNINFLLNQIVFNFNEVESIFFGETHYMSSVDFSNVDEGGNFIKEDSGYDFAKRFTGSDIQNTDEGVLSNIGNIADEIPTYNPNYYNQLEK